MYQKLFQITLVLFLVVLSIAVIGLVVSAVISMFSPADLIAELGGISAYAGGISNRLLGFMIVAASLIIAGFYLFFRRGRFRR